MLASIRTTASRLVNRAARYVEVAPSQMMASTTRASVFAAGSSEMMDFQPDCVKNALPRRVQCVGGDAQRIANHHASDHGLVKLGLDDHLTGVAHVEDASVRQSSATRLLVSKMLPSIGAIRAVCSSFVVIQFTSTMAATTLPTATAIFARTASDVGS